VSPEAVDNCDLHERPSSRIYSYLHRYEEAAKAYRQADAKFTNPTLTLQVLLQTDPKLTSAKKFHAYVNSQPDMKQLESEKKSMEVAILALQKQLASLLVQENEIDEEDYQGRLQILQKRAEKMSEVATLKQNMKAVVVKINTLIAIHRPNMPVVERELKRNQEAQQETTKMIETWKVRQSMHEKIKKERQRILEQAMSSAAPPEDETQSASGTKELRPISTPSPEALLAAVRAARKNSTSRQHAPRRVSPFMAPHMPGGLPPLSPTVDDADAKAEPTRSAQPPRSLWEEHPVYGQIPSAYAAFPDINDIPSSSPGRPLGAPLRTLSELLRDVGPLSQAISTQAQATAQAAHAQVQKQVKETTGAVANDLKHVLEGFLSNLGGQLATFEEGFKERLETAVPKSKPAEASTRDEPAQTSETKPELDVKVPAHKKAGTRLASFTFNTRLCDGCDQNPTLINFKCTDVSQTLDTCVSSLSANHDANLCSATTLTSASTACRIMFATRSFTIKIMSSR
jgi:hypothetical protein